MARSDRNTAFYLNQLVTWELTLHSFRQLKRFSRPKKQVTLLFFFCSYMETVDPKNVLLNQIFLLYSFRVSITD